MQSPAAPETTRDGVPRVAIVGAGISGLTAAHALGQAQFPVSVTLFEASAHVGGILQTITRDGFLIERSADSFITDPPHALELCHDLGLGGDLIGTSTTGRRALVLCRGKLIEVPPGFVIMAPRRLGPVMRSSLLSWKGKLRLLEELQIPPRSPLLTDESVASFARRRFGEEVYARLIQPLVGAIYTGDPEKLSMAATMPRYWDAEATQGSVLRAMQAADRATAEVDAESAGSGARYGLFVAPRRGMAALPEAIAAALPEGAIRLGHLVENLHHDPSGWKLTLSERGQPRQERFDALILAVAPRVAADLLEATDAQLSAKLRRIPSAGATIVCLGYHRRQLAEPRDAFGFVVPQIEQRRILAGSFLSSKFADRAPPDSILMRIFVGGALQNELVDLPEQTLIELVCGELRDLLGVQGSPQVVEIARWHGAMPQYHVGHLNLMDQIDRLVQLQPALALAGNGFRGVGVAPCVRSGQESARRVIDCLRTRAG